MELFCRDSLRLRLSMIFVALLFLSSSRGASIFRHTPKFGTPLVTSNQLTFTFPDARKPTIVSINRDTGKKIWELAVTNKDVQLWRTSASPIVSIDTNLFELNVSAPSLQHRFQTQFEIQHLHEVSPSLFLLQQLSTDIRTNLSIAVRRTDWMCLWTRTNIYQILDSDSERVLVQFAEPDFSGQRFVSHGWPMKNMAIALLNAHDGAVIWQRPTSAT